MFMTVNERSFAKGREETEGLSMMRRKKESASARELKPASVRQAASRRKAAKPAMARILSVYDGRECVGTVKVRDGAAVAYDAKGKRLGSFSSVQAAQAAFKQKQNVDFSDHTVRSKKSTPNAA
jgi:hypothetical protein